MKKWTLRVCLFLLAGAIVNVAVAWGVRLKAIRAESVQEFPPSADEQHWCWEFSSAYGGWPPPSLGVLIKAFGYRQTQYVLNDTPVPNDSMNLAVRERFGWPCLALESSQLELDDDSRDARRDQWLLPEGWRTRDIDSLPAGVHWPGFVLNALFYGAILCLLFTIPGRIRRHLRLRRGLCPKCAYPIGASDVCTECGAPRPRRNTV